MMRDVKRILVTGGAGFIGSAFIRLWLQKACDHARVVNLDLMTYAADKGNLKAVEGDSRYRFVLGDIGNQGLVEALCHEEKIDTIIHFAAESHVDRSIMGPLSFVKTNVEGTVHLLEVVRRNPHIHFHHISTDEVYGSLGKEGSFTEDSSYSPRSPYAATKASSDHLVMAYASTYGLSVTMSHCSNNFGPGQHREKFIPTVISCLVSKTSIPIYGDGGNVRDWLYVEDHVEGVLAILKRASSGSIYDIGGGVEMSNLSLARKIITLYAKISGESPKALESLITFVADRPGHDFRYSIDAKKIAGELGFTPMHSFEHSLQKTIHWYLAKTEKQEMACVEG